MSVTINVSIVASMYNNNHIFTKQFISMQQSPDSCVDCFFMQASIDAYIMLS